MMYCSSHHECIVQCVKQKLNYPLSKNILACEIFMIRTATPEMSNIWRGCKLLKKVNRIGTLGQKSKKKTGVQLIISRFFKKNTR